METAEFVAHFRRLFPDLVGGRVAVALSGGRDSVALLHLLRSDGLDLELEAVHVHHRLRGADAEADAAFCRRLCGELGVPFALVELATDEGSPSTGEAAWRRWRYRALLEHAAARRAAAVATAHHRDDVAEGVLVQLLRGAGPRAMAGIAADSGERIIRPLLPWGRAEIDEWLAGQRLAWREDASNRDLERLRNRVRHVLLPELEVLSPGLRGHLVHLASALAEAEGFLADEVARLAPFIDPWDPVGGVELAALRALPPALRVRWLHGQMRRLGVEHTSRRQAELFAGLLDCGRPRAVTMGGRWRLRSARGRLWAEPPTPPAGTSAELSADGAADLGVPGWQVRLRDGDTPAKGTRWSWSPARPDSVLTLRPATGRDLLPEGGDPPRRVRALLADALPRHLREAWPVFCEDDMIHWIPGVWRQPEPAVPSGRLVEVTRR
ncbi:MAG TPA: tRNA lysidine(34) synthetase TilS [Methylomirabilota bacterium]|nr:tRNA lysidine(34) synthetase TilS [Methylomirabilota bacterium]